MKRLFLITSIAIVSTMSNAMEERGRHMQHAMDAFSVLVNKHFGQSPLSQEILDVYKTCLSRRTHPEPMDDHLRLEKSYIELLRSLYESTAYGLEPACKEDVQIVVAHKGMGNCAACITEKTRAKKLAELCEALQGQSDAVKRLMAIQCALSLLKLEPLEQSLQQARENRNAVENDLRMCSAWADPKP